MSAILTKRDKRLIERIEQQGCTIERRGGMWYLFKPWEGQPGKKYLVQPVSRETVKRLKDAGHLQEPEPEEGMVDFVDFGEVG